MLFFAALELVLGPLLKSLQQVGARSLRILLSLLLVLVDRVLDVLPDGRDPKEQGVDGGGCMCEGAKYLAGKGRR